MAETKAENSCGLDNEYEMLKKELRSIALSVGPAVYVSVEQLDRDYTDINNYPVPYQKFGYISFIDLLKSMPDALALVDCGADTGTTAVVPISDAKTLHIEHLIAGQRPSSPTRFGGMVPGLDNLQRESGNSHQYNNRHQNNRRSSKNIGRNYRSDQKMQNSSSAFCSATRNPNPPSTPQLPSTMIQNFRDRHNSLNNCQILPGYENIWLESGVKFGAKPQNSVDSAFPNNDCRFSHSLPPPLMNSTNQKSTFPQQTVNQCRPSFKYASNQNSLFQKAISQISSPRNTITASLNSSLDNATCNFLTHGATTNQNVPRFQDVVSQNNFPVYRFSTPSQNSAPQNSTRHRRSPPSYSTYKNADFPDGEFLEIVVENLLHILREPPRRSYSLKDVKDLYSNRFPDDPPLNLLESFSCTISEFVADNLSSKIEIVEFPNGDIYLRYKPQTMTEAINDCRYCREMPKIRNTTPAELYEAVYANVPRKSNDYASYDSSITQSKLATPLKPRPLTPPMTAGGKFENNNKSTENNNKTIFDSSSIRRMAYEIAFGEPCPAVPSPLNDLDAEDDYSGASGGGGAASSSSAASNVLRRDPAVLAYEKQKKLSAQMQHSGQHFDDAQEFVRRAAAAATVSERERLNHGFPDRAYNEF
uniref:HTH OST-type domain-containing protein n=1 Tax=Romanomermis culicivorax TaxID=13658 RepID=A0A915KZU7_ROMCU